MPKKKKEEVEETVEEPEPTLVAEPSLKEKLQPEVEEKAEEPQPEIKVEVEEPSEPVETVLAELPSEAKEEPVEEAEPAYKGPPTFTIASQHGNFTREDAQVSGTVAVIVRSMKVGETIRIKRVW